MEYDAEEAVGHWVLPWSKLIKRNFDDLAVRNMARNGDHVIIQIRSVEKADRVCSACGFHLRGSFVCSCPGRKYVPALMRRVQETMFHTFADLSLQVCSSRTFTLYSSYYNHDLYLVGGERVDEQLSASWKKKWQQNVVQALLGAEFQGIELNVPPEPSLPCAFVFLDQGGNLWAHEPRQVLCLGISACKRSVRSLAGAAASWRRTTFMLPFGSGPVCSSA